MPPLVIGHAAAAGEAPANTLAGVRACLAAAADGMEIDVQLSADGVPVLMHDETVDRTTNLRGRVRDLSLAQLQAADAGNGEPVPSLAQVLEAVAGRLTVICELKATPGDGAQDGKLVTLVLDAIHGAGAESWCAVHSFSAAIVAAARAANPRVPAALISGPVDAGRLPRVLEAALERDGQAVSLEHSSITPAAVLAAKRRQLTVFTWTPDSEADWSRVAAAGVDGIITNLPSQLRAWVSRR